MPENEFLGHTARHASPDFLQAARDYRDIDQRSAEIERLPLGIPLTPERLAAVSDIESAIVIFAAQKLGVDIADRVFPVTSNNIRFYGHPDYVQVSSDLEIPGDHRGFTTAATRFVGVEETESEGSTLLATQHELVHKFAVRQTAIRQTPESVAIGPWRDGVSTPKRFGVIDEAIVLELTRRIKDEEWPEYAELAPYAATIEAGIEVTANMGEGQYDSGIVYCAFFEAMCKRAFETTGDDVESSLFRMHFNGDYAALHGLSKAFGNPAVTLLSKLDIHTVRNTDILEVASAMNVEKEFMTNLRAYKDLAVQQTNQ